MNQLDIDLENYYDDGCDYECSECGTPMETKGVCSRDCFNASML